MADRFERVSRGRYRDTQTGKIINANDRNDAARQVKPPKGKAKPPGKAPNTGGGGSNPGTNPNPNLSGSSTDQPVAVAQKNPFSHAGPKTQDALETGLDVGKVNQQGSILGQNANINGPTGGQKVTVDPVTGQATVTQVLSDDQQKILDQGSKLTQMGQEMAGKNLQGYDQFKADTRGMEGYQADLSGMPGQYKADTSGMGAYSFDSSDTGRQRIEDSVFKRLTRNVDAKQGQDTEALKQSLADRGIPYSNDPNSRYQQEMKDLTQRYDDVRSNAQAQAVEMGGSEMARSYDISSGTYNTNLGGNQARNSANLQEHQQGVSDVQTTNAIDLAGRGQNLQEAQMRNAATLQEHQQGMSDTAALQGMGTGLLMPNLPTYQGAGMDVTAGAGVQQQQQQINNQTKQTDATVEALKRRGSGRSGSTGGGGGTSPFVS